jgi:hypothetical protein
MDLAIRKYQPGDEKAIVDSLKYHSPTGTTGKNPKNTGNGNIWME